MVILRLRLVLPMAGRTDGFNTKYGHTKKEQITVCSFHGDLAGNRTRDCAVRGRRLNRLTTRPFL